MATVERAVDTVTEAGETPAAMAPVLLVQFPPIWGRNVSPFALKLETWLRLSGIPFVVEASTRLDKAPRGKFPYIVDAGERIGDSSLIIDHLKTTRGIDPDAGLSRRQKAEGVALQRLFENHLYYLLVHSRWIDPLGWEGTSEHFFAAMPRPVRPLARAFFRRKVRRLLHGQGFGRHSSAELRDFARTDLEAIAEHLGEKPFFLGEQLTSVDAVAFGFLANILLVPLQTELQEITREFPNLVAWCEAMEAGIYGGGDS